MQEKRLGNIYGFTGGSYAGLVYDKNFLAPSLNAMQGGQQTTNDNCSYEGQKSRKSNK